MYGLDINPFAYGLHDCDHQIIVNKLSDPHFIQDIIKICEEYHIDILIPGTDHDALFYARYEQVFIQKGIKVIVAKHAFLELTRDKVACGKRFAKITDIFVKGYNNTSFAEIKNGV